MKALLVVLVAACTSSDSVLCSDGTHCPADTTCAPVTLTDSTMVDLCVPSDAITACSGKQEGDACATGTCHGGACIANACGNHLLDTGEQCDDGNQTSGDGCSADCLSDETCGNGIIDLAKGEQCDDGDHVGHDGCSSACIAERAQWRSFGLDRPTSLYRGTLSYDEHRHRMVMLDPEQMLGEIDQATIEWDGTTWRTSTPVTVPTLNAEQAATYDAKHHDVIVFSGVSGGADTWSYDGNAWTEVTTAHSPPARARASMVYDSNLGAAVLFGGYTNDTSTPLNDTWTFDGTDWTQVATPTSPAARDTQAMAYDAHRNVVVMFGGAAGATTFGDLWEFNGATWAQKTFVGGPAARFDSAMAFDPQTNKVMVAGGSASGTLQKDAWEWDGSVWNQVALVPTPLAGFSRHAMVTDGTNGRIALDDTAGNLFYWNGSAWSVSPDGLTTTPASQFQRESAMGFTDLVHHTIVVFGGTTNHESSGPLADTLVLGDSIVLEPGASPPARWAGTVAYDTRRDSAVVFGGCSATQASSDVSSCATANTFADTWKWHAGAWSQNATSGPPPRSHAMMVYDSGNDRMVLFGGIQSSLLGGLSDTWLYDGATSTWTQAIPAKIPPPRWAAAMGYDPLRRQTIVFGGKGPNGTTSGTNLEETWMWNGSNWTQLSPSLSPSPRYDMSLIWDPSRRRLVLTGGRNSFGLTLDETWEWDGTTWIKPVVGQVSGLANGRSGYVGVPSPTGSGIMILAGYTSQPTFNFTNPVSDRWLLRWDGQDTYETCSDDDGDHDGLVGCADPDCWWACSSRCMPGDASCTLPPTCGDGACDGATESCDTCPADCGVCAPHCGDFTCNGSDSMTSCPGDCP